MRKILINLLVGWGFLALFSNTHCLAQSKEFTDDDNKQSIHQLVRWLESENNYKREGATKELIVLAKETSENRTIIINDLVELISHQDMRAKLALPAKSFRVWENANTIFAEIEAIEAIDTIINCIYCSSGLVGDQPAYGTLVTLGKSKSAEKTIEKLSAILQKGDKPSRSFSAVILGSIGGNESKVVLQKNFDSETDEEVKEWIKTSLEMDVH